MCDGKMIKSNPTPLGLVHNINHGMGIMAITINKCWLMLQRSLSHVWTNVMKCETHSSVKNNLGNHQCFWLHSHHCTKFTPLNEVLMKLLTSKIVKNQKWFSGYVDAKQHIQPFSLVWCNQMHKLELKQACLCSTCLKHLIHHNSKFESVDNGVHCMLMLS